MFLPTGAEMTCLGLWTMMIMVPGGGKHSGTCRNMTTSLSGQLKLQLLTEEACKATAKTACRPAVQQSDDPPGSSSSPGADPTEEPSTSQAAAAGIGLAPGQQVPELVLQKPPAQVADASKAPASQAAASAIDKQAPQHAQPKPPQLALPSSLAPESGLTKKMDVLSDPDKVRLV